MEAPELAENKPTLTSGPFLLGGEMPKIAWLAVLVAYIIWVSCAISQWDRAAW